jgi:hypothetical protein
LDQVRCSSIAALPFQDKKVWFCWLFHRCLEHSWMSEVIGLLIFVDES